MMLDIEEDYGHCYFPKAFHLQSGRAGRKVRLRRLSVAAQGERRNYVEKMPQTRYMFADYGYQGDADLSPSHKVHEKIERGAKI
jgi:hypothetical protein